MAKMKYETGDLLKVTANTCKHGFKIGAIVEVYRKYPDWDAYDVCEKPTGDCWMIRETDTELFKSKIQINMLQQANQMIKTAVQITADKLLATNGTTTTLDVKNQLRIDFPFFYWVQNSEPNVKGVSEWMDELANDGCYAYSFDGHHRTYVALKPLTGSPVAVIAVGTPNSTGTTAKTKGKILVSSGTSTGISKNKAEDLIKNSKGHFFTAVVIKDHGKGDRRVMNCQLVKNPKKVAPGCLLVRETSKLKTGAKPFRNLNIQELLELRIGGTNYKVV